MSDHILACFKNCKALIQSLEKENHKCAMHFLNKAEEEEEEPETLKETAAQRAFKANPQLQRPQSFNKQASASPASPVAPTRPKAGSVSFSSRHKPKV